MQDPPFRKRHTAGVEYWSFTAAHPGVRAAFSTRRGGTSERPFDTLNLGRHVGDDPRRVDENRRRWQEALGCPVPAVSPRQRHGARVVVLDGGDPGDLDPCDGLVTATPRRPLLLCFADCVPVVISGDTGGTPVVAVVHAGRRGLMAGVIGAAVAAMTGLGAAPGGMAAAVGPAIGRCCYKVDGDTAAGFRRRFGATCVEGRRLDLKAAAAAELAAAGLDAGNVFDIDICTSCDGDFFSYRRDGPVTGRQGAIAWLE